jgi:uncharacterized protein (TIGR02271 family)
MGERDRMDSDEDGQRIALVEERLEVGTREIERGRVQIRTKVDTREELVEMALRQDDVLVDRVPIDRPVETAPVIIREEDGVLIVPIMEERLVVTKQLVLKEELRIRTRTRVEAVRQPVLLRSERAEVTRTNSPEHSHTDDTTEKSGSPALLVQAEQHQSCDPIETKGDFWPVPRLLLVHDQGGA